MDNLELKYQAILDRIDEMATECPDLGKPVFEVFMIQHANKQMIGIDGSELGLPELGHMSSIGFYYDIWNAVDALHQNMGDFRADGGYECGFVLVRYQGVYSSVIDRDRMFFMWDEDRKGYFEAEEPELLNIIAF